MRQINNIDLTLKEELKRVIKAGNVVNIAAATFFMYAKWFPYNKRGEFRKWYGNDEFVVNYLNDGFEMKKFHEELNKTSSGGRIKNQEYYFRESITWSFISIVPCFRNCKSGHIFDVAGSSLFVDKSIKSYLLGLLSSSVVVYIY